MNKPERSGSGFSSSKQTSEATRQQIEKSSTDHANQEQQALALINGGRLTDAESLYRELIESGSKSHTAYGNLGVILKMKGDLRNAIMYFKKAIQINPNFPDAHNNLGVSLQEQSNPNAAIASYNTAIKLKPNYPEAHYNLGNALQEQGDSVAAIISYNVALKLKPNYPEAHYNLGNALQKQGDLSTAISSYKTALELRFNYPDAHNNLGVALKDKHDLTAAIASFNNAIKLKPNFPDAHYNLGNALLEQGDIAAAFESFNNALKIDPNYPDAHWNASLIMLLDGDYNNGWEQYEWRFNRKKATSKLHAQPKCDQWKGNLTIKTTNQLLLVAEQGLGDTLQFMRYAIALRDQGICVSLCAQTQLHSLIKTSGIHHSPLTPEQASQVTEGEWIPLLSVPRSLEVTPENPIITEPYIKTTEELISKWAGILGTQERPIIGINWQGNPKAETTGLRGRSLPLETFAPIAEQTSASLLALQKGFGSEQLETCSFKHRFVSCQDQVNEAWDFLETAAIIANCDLVITSDTSVAHLAGGMGKTTWLLLKNVPDWRWGLEGDTTFWYPSMRLFRQQQRGNWDEVLERVVEALQLHFKDTSTPHQALKAPQDVSKTPKDTLDIQPQRASTLNELGLYHSSQKNFESAASYFKKAIEINKTCCDPYINYGNLLSQQSRYDDALEQYLKALEIDESNGLCLHNIGSTLQAIGALEEALQFYRYALENNYQSSDLMYNLGMLFRDLNKPRESAEAFKEAHLIDPDNNRILSQYITMKKITASWEEMPIRRRFKAQYISDKHGAFDPFFYAGHHDDPELQHLNAAMHASTVICAQSKGIESFNPQKVTKQTSKSAKLKIGYFSSNFNSHPVLHLIKGVLSKHDTSKFDVYLFDICSSPNNEDPYLKEIKKLKPTYLYIGNLPIDKALAASRSFDLNIAIDLMGYTEDNKIELFANRIAPVQINYLGYPGTTGSDTINDYIIADSVVIPKQHEKYYSEQVIRLPDCYQCNDDKRKIDDSSTLGPKDPLLEQAKFVFCCFNNTWKITSKEFDIWMRLLKKVNGSVLWLLADNNTVIENLKKEAKAREVDPTRIIFAERVNQAKHLARHQWADLFLDTFTYNAHTTASDALWAGLPVLTLKGKSFPSRVGASILTAAGLAELITSSEDDYEAKALWLAEHPDELMEIRNQLSDNRLQCSLFNTTQTTRNLERIYQNCWQNLINSAPK